MADVILKLGDEHAGKTKEEILNLFEQEVDRFSAFMASLGDSRVSGHLIKQERHLLKTYLVQKFTGKIEGA